MTGRIRKVEVTQTCQGTLWVCVCCMLKHANDECCEDHARPASERVTLPGNFYTGPVEPEPAPWMLWQYHQRTNMTMGMLLEEHNDNCPNRKAGFHGADECDCEEKTFSTSECEGCGSASHGVRHAFSYWS